MPNYQGVWSLSEQYQNASGWPSPPPAGTAFFGGGLLDGNVLVSQVDSINAAGGTATDFGDLTVARFVPGACSSSTRGVWAGGSNFNQLNTIDFVSLSSGGTGSDFGDLLFVASGGDSGLFFRNSWDFWRWYWRC